jgi:hypothetical protein
MPTSLWNSLMDGSSQAAVRPPLLEGAGHPMLIERVSSNSGQFQEVRQTASRIWLSWEGVVL